MSLCVAVFLSAGCIFIPTSQLTVDKWRGRVNTCIPVGTSREELYRIMAKHGFEHSIPLKDSSEYFDKDTGFNEIGIIVYMQIGKTMRPLVTTVMRDGNM